MARRVFAVPCAVRMRSLLLIVAAVVAFPAEAQTQQWSQPTTTGQWSQPTTTGQWSQPATAEREPDAGAPAARRPSHAAPELVPSPAGDRAGAAPAAREGAAAGRAPAGPFDPRLVGHWSVRIPTGVGYRTDGRSVYQVVTPGADLERLEVRADGRYCWGSHCGEARRASPYFEMPGERYYTISDGKDDYALAFVEARGSVKIVYTGGGLMAEGQRAQRPRR